MVDILDKLINMSYEYPEALILLLMYFVTSFFYTMKSMGEKPEPLYTIIIVALATIMFLGGLTIISIIIGRFLG